MKRIIGFTLAFFISYNLQGQPKFERSALNQEFINYVNKVNSPGYKKSASKYGTGYVPSPMYLHFNPGHVARESRKSAQVVLPTKFDQRDSGWITSVKNQGSLGACWSFSTMGALESRIIRLKKGHFNVVYYQAHQ